MMKRYIALMLSTCCLIGCLNACTKNLQEVADDKGTQEVTEMEEKKPYSTEIAKAKMALLKEVLK